MSAEKTDMKQPCWTCRLSYGQCPWSKNFQPIEGWEAELTHKTVRGKVVYDSFEIKHCPMYQQDESSRKFDEKIRKLLAFGMSKATVSIIMGVSVRYISCVEKGMNRI